jgi:N-methylhydantoinase A
VLAALADLVGAGRIDPQAVGRLTHGTTIATNAILERSWARTALITTAGFRDLLEIGRQNRLHLYDLFQVRPPSVVPRDLRFEATERIDSDGRVHIPLDRAGVEGLIPDLMERGVEAIAISFLFSYLNPAHEREAARILSSRLDLPIALSSDVLPEFREYERTSTTVISAALRPVLRGYLTGLEDGARRLRFKPHWQIMQSGGTVASAANAEMAPARIALSGPAAGVRGADAVGRLIGEKDLITMDMGGTSCDVSLIRDGRIETTRSGAVGGYPLAVPMVEIRTIGAGGGSIAWIDRGGALRVGPESAGADPGPVCYGLGGSDPTVTDANAVLGRINPCSINS